VSMLGRYACGSAGASSESGDVARGWEETPI
jgi:hypothetical protein